MPANCCESTVLIPLRNPCVYCSEGENPKFHFGYVCLDRREPLRILNVVLLELNLF
eukprot:m.6962 g.6962  ORF g.6962 m.6962 type:complete len:56 (+) comp17334_c0_seq1:181-348(+)